MLISVANIVKIAILLQAYVQQLLVEVILSVVIP